MKAERVAVQQLVQMKYYFCLVHAIHYLLISIIFIYFCFIVHTFDILIFNNCSVLVTSSHVGFLNEFG